MTSANLECNTHKESYGVLILYICGVFLSLHGKSYMKTLQKCLVLCFTAKKHDSGMSLGVVLSYSGQSSQM